MKKTVGILSVLLALTIAVNAITPAMSVTIQKVFSPEPRVASVMDSVFSDEYVSGEDDAASNGKTATGTAPDKKETAYDDGKILIYNFEQLSMIGSGKSYTYEDGVTATYASDAEYKLARDIPIPRHTLWQLPDGFTGKITGEKQSYAPLYDAQKDAIYLYNPYQLAVMAMENREEQPVMSGDADAPTFGSGKVVCTDEANKHILTYSDDRNYVISAQFSSEVTEKPISVSSKKSVEAVGAKADSTVGEAAPYDGRDFAGQVLKKINGITYILIGNEDQLRAIGTDEKVWTPVYKNNTLLYGGDADLTQQQNGSGNFTFHQLSAGSTDYPRAGVNQETGKVYTDSLHVDDSAWGTAHSWETNAKYTTNANYIIFRDIDLGGSDRPWTPLMFSGTMYGIKSTNNDKLWNGSDITDSTAPSAMTETNRPKIKNVYVSTSSSLSLNDYIGVGFFATVQSQANSNEGDLGLRGKKAEVKNLDLQNVTVINNATTATGDPTLVSSLLGFTGAVLGAAVKALLNLLNFNFEQIVEMLNNPQQVLDNQLGDMLDARKDDPDVFATGAFAGRVYGNVNIEVCRVMGTVSVTNNSGKGRTGGFVGYITGFTEYSNLSNLLGGTVDLLARVLNVVPAIGLGDLITVIGDNALPLGQLIAVGYVNPTVNNCTVQGLAGNVGTATAEYAGGFVGEQIGTRITGCKVLNSTFTVSAKDFGGGFSGLTRDADIVGTLGEFGGEFEKELVENIRPQSTLIDCEVKGCTYSVGGGSYLGGFVGALASSYSVDCTIDNDQAPLSVTGTGEYIGGFCGYATVGWTQSIGKPTDSTLIGVVSSIALQLLSQNPEDAKALLSISGVSPSAILGCRIYSSSLTVKAQSYTEDGKTHGGTFAGGILGKGDGVYIAKSDSAAYTALEDWHSGTLKDTPDNRSIIVSGLESVEADVNYSGGVAGYVGSASINGLLNDTAGIGDFIGFTARDITVTGVSGGYTVTSGNYDAGGGFGAAVGGTITNVKLNELKSVEAFNCAAGFVGVAGPGELVGTGGLTVNLLGLNRALALNNLLKVGQGVEVHINDCDVTGINSGFTVEAKGTNVEGAENVYEFTAAGFIAGSNSTKITDSHCYKLLSVTASDHDGYAGGLIGTSETGGLADMAGNNGGNITALLPTDTDENGAVVSVNGLVDAIGYLIPKYTNCTTNFVNGGYVDADIAGGFVADFESGTVDNSDIAKVDDAQNPKWTHTMKEIYDPDAVPATGDGDINKQFAVINIDNVHGRTYGGGFGGKLRSGALAESGKGISILGGLQNASINVKDLLSIMNTYVPFVKNAGVYSANDSLKGFTVTANEIRSGDPNSGSAGGFAGYMSGAQVSNCDVYQLKHTDVTPPSDLEAVSATSYFDDQSAYAVTGGRFAGGYVGNADIGDAASVGGGLGVLGKALDLDNIASALSVVVTTIEHSDVQGAAGGFSVIADGTDATGKVGRSGGYVGESSGAHIQNSHCKNFYYIIGQETAGGYVGNLKPGDVAKLLDNASVIDNLLNIEGPLLSLVEDFVPTIRNSTTSCVPCGGAVRADAASDNGHQRGCAGGYCGLNEGGHIWGLNTNTWQRQNDGAVGSRNFGHDTEGNYTGEQHIATAWRIRSVYGAEYAGGFTGYMVAADTASTGNISLLGGLVKTDNLLNALSVVYPTDKNTAVYGPLRNVDGETWNAWAQHVGKYGGYGLDIVKNGLTSPQSKYYYGCHVVAGRTTATDNGTYPITEGGDAGGYVGLMRSGVISNGHSYDMKLVRAMRNAGGYAGSMQTGGLADVGEAEVKLFGLNLSADLDTLVSALGEVFVPTVRSGSVRGWESGLTVNATGVGSENDDVTYRCGYAGGYVGSAYGAQIWGNKSVGEAAGTGCNVYKLRYVRGTNAVGGFVGLATSASVAAVDTNASQRGLLKNILSSVVKSKGNLVSVLNATLTTIYQAQVNPSENNESDSFGFVVEGMGGTLPLYAGGFAGELDATVIGDKDENVNERIIVNKLRSVNAKYYAGGFFGYADVKGVADVSDNDETYLVGGLLDVGEVNVLAAFRPYIYYSEVNGVDDGIIVRAHNEGTNSLFSETRKTGCAGGFGGAMMDGTVRNSKVTNLNTVVAKNYTGGFIGHMGKSGVVNANGAQLTQLLGATAGVFDIMSTHTYNCDVIGIPNGAVINATGGSEPIAGGFVGYADVSKINNCHVQNLKQVTSDEIAGGFAGRTDRHFLVSVEAGSPLVQGVTFIVNALLAGLLVNDLQSINLADLNLGILEVELLGEGKTAYVDLLGLKIGVSLLTHDDNGNTGTVLVTIGDSSVELAYTDGQIDFSDSNSAGVAVNLIKGNRTRIENSSVKGIDIGYDVYGGGASNTSDGSGANGKAGGFVGFNNEGHLLNNRMEYCDTVRGAPQMTGPFSGNTSLQSVYSFNTLQSIEGENNTYAVYRDTDATKALTKDNQTIANATTEGDYKRFDITHLAAPIVPGENESYEKIYQKWKGASLASGDSNTGKTALRVYVTNAKAVLMSDTPTELNDESLIPNPGESKDPCDKKILFTIQKIWQDEYNKDESRPDSIKVRLWQHWLNQDGTPVIDGSEEKVVLFTDNAVVSDIDTTDGWFSMTKTDHERADSATWTRVVDGLPVYTADNSTYYSYTVEEAPIVGYTVESNSVDEIGSTATIVNRAKTFEIKFKYYDRYQIDGRPAGIDDKETVYTVSLTGIPIQYVKNVEGVESVDYAGLIGETAVEFSDRGLAVNNVMCDYDLWTSQSDAVEGMAQNAYFVNGQPVSYSNNEIYHTDFLGKPHDHTNYQGQAASKNEKWVSYYKPNTENENASVEVVEAEVNSNFNYRDINQIVVWCYNYPRQYNVDIYGAAETTDLTEQTVDSNTVYVADAAKTKNAIYQGKFYYNQRFRGESGKSDQDDPGFIGNYGFMGYTNVYPAEYTAETIGDYTFAYWAYDQEGTQIASVDRDFGYRVSKNTKLYAVYSSDSTAPGISISANENDTYVDSNGVSRTRLNIWGSVYGVPDYDTNVKKLSFANFSLSEQIRDNSTVYTPERINALFLQYKEQLKGIIEEYDGKYGSKSFSDYRTLTGDIDEESGKVDADLQLVLTTKGFIYTVVSNGNTAGQNDAVTELTNKNRTHFTAAYKTTALNVNNTGSNGDTCLVYFGALKYNNNWSISTNCLIYFNGNAVDNIKNTWE